MERRTRQRCALDELLERTQEFRSAQQLHAQLREDGESVSLATVYRLLQGMVRDGEIDVLRSEDNENRYRRCQCGYTVEVTETAVRRWADRTARTHGFISVSHAVELLGVCAGCGDNGGA